MERGEIEFFLGWESIRYQQKGWIRNIAYLSAPYLIVHKCFNQFHSLKRSKQARLIPESVDQKKCNANKLK